MIRSIQSVFRRLFHRPLEPRDVTPAGPPLLVFIIPLMPRAAAQDWDAVQADLRRTLASILHSDCDRFRILLVHHERPDLQGIQDPRLRLLRTWMPAKFATGTQRQQNRNRKRRLAAAWARRHLAAHPLYYMLLDADDLIDRGLVGHVTSDPRPDGYLVESGYNYDYTTGSLLRLDTGFEKRCGSCLIIRYSRSELPRHAGDHTTAFTRFVKRHKQFRAAAAELGKTIAFLPFPAVCYVANHPDSLMLYRRQGRPRSTIATTGTPIDPTEARRLLADRFAWHLSEPRQSPA